jgi:hypothetical protein
VFSGFCFKLPKLRTWVQFPSPAQKTYAAAPVSMVSKTSILLPSHGKFGPDLFERNFASVKRRHCSGGMAHLLANNGRVYSGKFPSPVAASSKSMHPYLLKSQSFQRRIESLIQRVGF